MQLPRPRVGTIFPTVRYQFAFVRSRKRSRRTKLLLITLLVLNVLCVVGHLFILIILQEPVESHVPLLENLYLRLSSASTLAVEFPAATRRVLTTPFPSPEWSILELVDSAI